MVVYCATCEVKLKQYEIDDPEFNEWDEEICGDCFNLPILSEHQQFVVDMDKLDSACGDGIASIDKGLDLVKKVKWILISLIQ